MVADDLFFPLNIFLHNDFNEFKENQLKLNKKWGLLLRKSLRSFTSGKIFFQDKLMHSNIFYLNFFNKGKTTINSNVIIKIFNSIEEIENLFKLDKPVTRKTFSFSYGRKIIHSRLILPLIITFDIETLNITFETEYETFIEYKTYAKKEFTKRNDEESPFVSDNILKKRKLLKKILLNRLNKKIKNLY